jgi:hypothetical protein
MAIGRHGVDLGDRCRGGGPTADEHGIDIRRVPISPILAASIKGATHQLPTLDADPGE